MNQQGCLEENEILLSVQFANLHVDEVNEDADMKLDANGITGKNRSLRAGLYPAYFEVVGLE